MSILVIVNPIR